MEPCPFCGMTLSTTLQTRSNIKTQQKPKIVFQKASTIPKLVLDIPKMDSVLQFLTLGQKISISGYGVQKIVERICVRAQMPHRYGGLATDVLLIDGANSSDLYQCVDFAQQYGLDANKILNGIIFSRAFTTYQLANTIIKELPHVIRQHNIKVVVITNLLNYFTNDPYLDVNEVKSIIREIVKTLESINDCLIIVSLEKETQYDNLFSKLFSRSIYIQNDNSDLSVCVYDNGNKKNQLLLKQEELEIIPQHC